MRIVYNILKIQPDISGIEKNYNEFLDLIKNSNENNILVITHEWDNRKYN
jgi:hypothetical protein